MTMFGMGASELMIILVIVLLLFGASKLPELGRSLGSGLSNFKKGLRCPVAGPDIPFRAPGAWGMQKGPGVGIEGARAARKPRNNYGQF